MSTKVKRAKTHCARYNSAALHHKILVNGKTVSIYGADIEDFDGWIYSILEQMYEKHEKERYNSSAIKRYNETFAGYNWYDHADRIDALNQLHDLNQARMKRMKPQIPLFAAEA